VSLLLANNARVDSQNYIGDTPLRSAEKRGHNDIAGLLRRHVLEILGKVTPSDAVLSEREAVEALENQSYERAANLFLALYDAGAPSDDRHLTHACVALWMGVQRSCNHAAQFHICAKTGVMDAAYACELFIGCVFKLRGLHPDVAGPVAAPIADSIRDTVNTIKNVLAILIDETNSTYAIPWYANVLRGMGEYAKCASVISIALQQPSLDESVAKQLRGCRGNIERYDRDSSAACEHVIAAFPEMAMINGEEVASLRDLASRMWSHAMAGRWGL
jgi:hypothetical protein